MAITTESLPCIGVVLAGGQSRRMGRDKALLAWRGKPLIEHQLATLRAAGSTRTLVSGTLPDYDGIADAQADAGPLAGLASVAATLHGDAQLLIIPVDMPLLAPALLACLCNEQPQARCLRFAEKILPMRLRVDATTRTLLDDLLGADEPRARSLHALQQALDCAEIPLRADEATQLTDCNTAATWHEVTA